MLIVRIVGILTLMSMINFYSQRAWDVTDSPELTHKIHKVISLYLNTFSSRYVIKRYLIANMAAILDVCMFIKCIEE